MSRPQHPPPVRGLHLDFKGVMCRPAYIPQLLADLADQGINTVLVEYEDVFPFAGLDLAGDRSVVWSRQTLAQFQTAAARNGIEIIPLQQCLGHLEYVFRWRKYRRFAEDPRYPATLCLSNPAGKRLIAGMLRQIITAHPASRWVHLGLDEARSLATCPHCRARGDVLTVFLEYLRELCDLCEAHGRTPIIWSDMLEDHFRPDAFGDIKDRVILTPWDYGRHGAVDYFSRVGGWRTSRAWLQEPENPAAPALSDGTQFLEDLPASVRRVLAPYRRGRGFVPLLVADLWTKLGFRVIGASTVRVSEFGPVLPDANLVRNNLAAWARAIQRTRQLGVIATSWARGTTFCPPNCNPDLTWPNIGFLTRALGAQPPAFWPGLAPQTVDRIIRQLGRSRRDWRRESSLAEEMATLAPKLRAHRYEWESLRLMARVLHWQRRAEFAQAEVDFFDANIRPVEPEWQRRLTDQKSILRDLVPLRHAVRRHFGRRYHGDAFAEWLRTLFDLPARRVRECQRIARRKLRQSRTLYAR